MNKQELIEKIESLPSLTSITSIRPYVDKKIVLGLISQLDEPEKAVISKFVADLLEERKEKRYIVKMKGLNEDSSYLNYDSIDDEWYFTDAENGPAVGTHHTRKQLEEAGFGWMFDCKGLEVDEVVE
jgi:gp178